MKKLLCVLSGIVLMGLMLSFHPRFDSKIDKNLQKIFDLEQVELIRLQSAVVATGFEAGKFEIRNERHEAIGFLVLTQGKGRSETFDFMVVYQLDGTIRQVLMLEYRSQQGYGVGSRSWLKQFTGKKADASYRLGSDIDGLTGATASVYGMIAAVTEAGRLFFNP